MRRALVGLLGILCMAAVSRAGWPRPRRSLRRTTRPTSRPRSSRLDGTQVYDAIGDQAAALVQGAPMVRGFVLPRQANEFYYLCGVETPHSYLLLDGRTRKATLFLPPRNARLERSEGRVLSAADVDLAKSLTGVAEVLSTEALRGEGLAALPGGLPL